MIKQNYIDQYKKLKEIVKMAFDYYDADGSGELDHQELQELLKDVTEALD